MSRHYMPMSGTGGPSVVPRDPLVNAPGYGLGTPSTDASNGGINGASSGFGSGGVGPADAKPPIVMKRVGGKANVSAACGPCKRAHLACDVNRPCRRCVNMGKDDMCEDVPHKKRGRPKVTKPMPGVPYTRNRPSPPGQTAAGRWRPPSAGAHRPHAGDTYGGPDANAHARMLLNPSTGPRTAYDGVYSPSQPSPPLFTVFSTIDLRIIRCTSASYALTGIPPQDYTNTLLGDWIHPGDRHLLEMEHGRLMMNPMGSGPLHTDQDTQLAMTNRSERELLTPVDGMREPYPNQNVRILRADQQYSFCNVRLHLGGGLGGSLWHPHTHGKVYFVVSILLLPPPTRTAPAPSRFTPTTAVPDFVPSLSASVPGSRRVSYDPPTPITPDPSQMHPVSAGIPVPYNAATPVSAAHPGFEYEPVVPYPSSATSIIDRSLPAELAHTPQPTPAFSQTFPRAIPAGYPTRSPSPLRHSQSFPNPTQQGLVHHNGYPPDSYPYPPGAGAGTAPQDPAMHASTSTTHTPTYSPVPAPPGQGAGASQTEYYPDATDRNWRDEAYTQMNASASAPAGFSIGHTGALPSSSSPTGSAGNGNGNGNGNAHLNVLGPNGNAIVASPVAFYQQQMTGDPAQQLFDESHSQQAQEQAVPGYPEFGRRAWEL